MATIAMRHVSKYLKREWELVACAVAAFLLAVFLLDWAVSRHGEDSRAGSGRIAEPPSVWGPGAFAFLEGTEAGPLPERNPFLSNALARPTARPERAVRREAPKPPPQAPVVAAPVPKPAPSEPPPAAPPVPLSAGPRLGQCDLAYVFSTVNRSGRPVALVEFRDPSKPGAAPLARNVSAGDVVYGVRVQSFTDQSLILTDAVGRRQSVAFGASRRVAVDLGTAP